MRRGEFAAFDIAENEDRYYEEAQQDGDRDRDDCSRRAATISAAAPITDRLGWRRIDGR
jgi:hypothetical protein